MKKGLMIYSLLLLTFFLQAEQIYLDDGSIIQGEIISEDGDTVTIMTPYGSMTIPADKVFTDFDSYKTHKKQKRFWQRHFFDLCGIGGMTFVSAPPGESFLPRNTNIFFGGAFGVSIGYQYAITPYFAIGFGGSFIASIVNNYYVIDTSVFNYTEDSLTAYYTGGGVVLQFMAGNIKDKAIAVLFDIGGGFLFTVKAGIYVKGFIVKAGYHLTGFGRGHNFTLDFGYKFKWAHKKG